MLRSALLCGGPIVLASALQVARATTKSQPAPRQPPIFSLGVIADVQWADTEDGSNFDKTVVRCYRGAFRTLQRAVTWWNERDTPFAFIAQLGDIIDGINVQLGESESALEAALSELRRASSPAVSIVGNHELYNFNRTQLAQATWLRHGDKEFYSFAPAAGWRVVVLDPYQEALIGHAQDDPRRKTAVELIGRKNPGVDPSGAGGSGWFKHVDGLDKRFVPYNGGLGGEQLAWLRSELKAASAARERVLIMCHVILHPKACGGSTMVWDYPEALEVIGSEEAGGCVAAVLCGHDHFGGYFCDEGGVHHCTFCSPLNKGDNGFAFGLMCPSPPPHPRTPLPPTQKTHPARRSLSRPSAAHAPPLADGALATCWDCRHVRDDSIEIVGPRVDDLLPGKKRGKPTDRPAAVRCEDGSGEQVVTLALRTPPPASSDEQQATGTAAPVVASRL